MKRILCCGLISATFVVPSRTFAEPTVRAQFVGCKSDGQMGPQPSPTSHADIPRLPASLAGSLAYYKSTYLGVLAPRGWHCFGLYGSNGEILLVTPTGIGRNIFDAHLVGSAVQLSVSIGDTSGRFEAARIAARLFPNRASFVDGVVKEGIEPKSDFPTGPFPTDITRRHGPDVVEFETPANREGMGTQSRLVKNRDPIDGFVAMDNDNDATVLVVRLPPAMRNLIPTIVKATE